MLHVCTICMLARLKCSQHKVQLALTGKDPQHSLEDSSHDVELVSILPCCLVMCLAGH